MRRAAGRIGIALLGLGLLLGGSGCTTASPLPQGAAAEVSGPMTQGEMELAFAEVVEKIDGPTGMIRGQVEGVNVVLVSDPANDRMRLVVGIARADQLDRRTLEILLRANFHTALDARYAISDGVVYGTYLHPLSTLTRADLRSAVHQVVSLQQTFGSTFSSGALQFGVQTDEPR